VLREDQEPNNNIKTTKTCISSQGAKPTLSVLGAGLRLRVVIGNLIWECRREVFSFLSSGRDYIYHPVRIGKVATVTKGKKNTQVHASSEVLHNEQKWL
jgi:hypothetical protein